MCGHICRSRGDGLSDSQNLPGDAHCGEPARIIIDAGHGGMDGGAVGYNNIVEKDINLAIAEDLRDLFVISGFDVVMTRDSDCSIHDDGITGVKKPKDLGMRNRLKIMEQNREPSF